MSISIQLNVLQLSGFYELSTTRQCVLVCVAVMLLNALCNNTVSYGEEGCAMNKRQLIGYNFDWSRTVLWWIKHEFNKTMLLYSHEHVLAPLMLKFRVRLLESQLYIFKIRLLFWK